MADADRSTFGDLSNGGGRETVPRKQLLGSAQNFDA
jgi:hypothetical protein